MPFSPAENVGLFRFSIWDKTPNSYSKPNYMSPFDTTCQKRSDYSPFSPGPWNSINSDLKRRKAFTFTPTKMILGPGNDDACAIKMESRCDGFISNPLLGESNFKMHSEIKLEFAEFPHKELYCVDEHFLSQGRSSNTSKPISDKWPSEKNARKSFSMIAKSSNVQMERCNCRSTGCLKLYCNCLRAGKMCINCNCSGCENHQHSSVRKDKIALIEKKRPQIFALKSERVKLSKKNGCNCRRSNCQKNYCECHQFGLRCGDACKCTQCKNVDENSALDQSKEKGVTPTTQKMK